MIAAATAALTACGGKNDTDNVTVDVTSEEIEPVDFEHGAHTLSVAQLDSMTNYPDDMTPGEAVGALEYMHHLTQKSNGTRRLVLMRKYKDFYDIVLGNYGDEFRKAIGKLQSQDSLDLSRIYDDYANVLSTGDDVAGGIGADEVKADTIKTFGDTVSTEVIKS